MPSIEELEWLTQWRKVAVPAASQRLGYDDAASGKSDRSRDTSSPWFENSDYRLGYWKHGRGYDRP